MATFKQVLFPVLALSGAVAIAIGFSAMKKPPAEKPVVDARPIVSVTDNKLVPFSHTVSSYGVVTGKYETQLVAQVAGEIQYISDAFVRGGFVKKGAILAKVDPIDYEAALIDAQAQLANAKSALVLEKAQGRVAEKEWSEITNGKPTELSLRKPQLAQEMAKLKSAQASLKRAKRNIERTVIRAPYDALIEARNIGLGSYVNNGNPIGKIISIDTAEVRLPVPDKELRFLKDSGKGASVQIEAQLAGQTEIWQGKIIRSEGVVDKNSRMTYLVAQVKDPYGLNSDKPELKFGSYVTVIINGDNAGHVSIVPRSLLIDGHVPVMTKDKKLALKPVKVLRETGANVVISSGLNNGDKVITSAIALPVNGMEVLTEKTPAIPAKQDVSTEQKSKD
ncbi:MAG: efflux RND transporter periplasmic adaptor subunit [Parashewanella sp.]